MQLLKFEYLKWTVWFIWKPYSNVRDNGWETDQKWLKGLRKLFDMWKFEIAEFEIPNRFIREVTENAEGTK